MAWDWIEKANESYPIARCLRDLGIEAPDIDSGSYKTDCPTAHLHPDGGRDKQFRYYPESNTAWCFEEQKMWTPVRIVSEIRGVPPETAAKALCEALGIRRPTVRELLARLEEAPPEVSDDGSMREAVRITLRLDPGDAIPAEVMSWLTQINQLVPRPHPRQIIETLEKWRDEHVG